MALELLAEEIRIERHLAGGDLHDAEPFEEPAALVAVFLHELVVGRGVVERGARVAVHVRKDEADVVLVDQVEVRPLDEDPPELLVDAFDARLLRRAVRVAVEDPGARDELVGVVVRAGVLGHHGIGERCAVVLGEAREELHEERPPRDAVEHVDDPRPRLGRLALLVEGEDEAALEDQREQDASSDLPLERAGLDDLDAGMLHLPVDEELVRASDAAFRVGLRDDVLRPRLAHAGVGEVAAADVEEPASDVGVDGLLAHARERPGVGDHDVPDGLVLPEPVLQRLVHLRERGVARVHALARVVQLRFAVGLRVLREIVLPGQVAGRLVPASVADEGRREKPLAGADLVVLALQEALVAVLAPLAHAAVRVADLRPPAFPVPPARRVRGLEALGRIDAPRLDLVGDGLRRPADQLCDLGDGEAAAKPVLDAVPVDDGHLCHVVSPFVNPAFPRGRHVRVGAGMNSLPNLKR